MPDNDVLRYAMGEVVVNRLDNLHRWDAVLR
jgi:hypothetical protein